MIPKSIRAVLPVVAAGGLLAAACGGDDDAADADSGGASTDDVGASVVVTTSIWADVVERSICAEESGIEVVTLIPANADPHDFEPSLQDRETLDEAELVVSNGLDLEAGYADLLSTVDDDRSLEIASLEGIDVGEPGEDAHDDHAHESDDEHSHDDEGEEHAHDEGEEHDDEDDVEEEEDHDHDHADHEHDHDGGDPHLWMDPQVVAEAVHPLADAITAATGADADAIEACANDYLDELDTLDGDIAGLIDEVPADQRVLVTNHDAYGYFADRYGLDIIGTILPFSTLAETNPADLNDLKDEIEATGARAIVVDAEHSSDDAEALADAIDGIEIVALYNGSLGDHDTYADMMRSNATELAEALGS